MQQRVGNRYWRNPQPARVSETVFCKDGAQNFRCTVTEDQAKYYANGNDGRAVIENSAIWARVEGAHHHIEPALSTSSSTYNSNVWKLQAGLDGLLHETEDGSQFLGGINLSYGRAWTDVTSPHGNGGMTTDGYGAGATVTWLDQNGFYVDGQANAMWFRSDLNSDTVGRLGDGNKGFGYALSVEAGKRIELNAAWSLTPQAQLVYSNVRFDSFTDPFGATVSLLDGDSLRGRLGLAAEYQESWTQDNGMVSRVSAYGIANLYNEFLDGTRVNVSGTEFASRADRLWGGVGLGGSYNWDDDKYSIYGEVLASTGLAHFGDSLEVGGMLGLRVKW